MDACPGRPRLLIVEDDEAIAVQLGYALRTEFDVAQAGDRAAALRQLDAWQPAVVTLDLGLPPRPDGPEEGFRTLEAILQSAPATRVIVMTGQTHRALAVRAVALGAVDYHLKPADVDELRVVLRRAAAMHALDAEGRRASTAGAPASPPSGPGAMAAVLAIVDRVARTRSTVLVQGESGTGKELVARAIHDRSLRRAHAFVPINCAAIPEALLESELFGHERGAFTGASVHRRGRFELADGGTLFLDEVGEMPPALQVKLLRFLQEREIERVGGRERLRLDVRVVAATNRDLEAEVRAGRFRDDLYYRLSVVVLRLPPLRERGEDIVRLAREFLTRAGAEQGRRLAFSGAALEALVRHAWPGNVRELQNCVERAVVLAEGRLVEPAHLGLADPAPAPAEPWKAAKHRAERELIVAALARAGGNVSQAARELGVSRPVLHEILTRLGISARDFRRVS